VIAVTLSFMGRTEEKVGKDGSEKARKGGYKSV